MVFMVLGVFRVWGSDTKSLAAKGFGVIWSPAKPEQNPGTPFLRTSPHSQPETFNLHCRTLIASLIVALIDTFKGALKGAPVLAPRQGIRAPSAYRRAHEALL